jgi:hypothetical protein
MKPIENQTDTKEIKEFYQNSNAQEVNTCEHFFLRLSLSRVQCKKCGLGFFDSPFDPFPVDEINKDTINERARQNYHKRKSKKDVVKTD